MFIQTTRNSYQPKTDVFSTFHSEPRIRNYYTTRTYRYHNVEKSNNNVKAASAVGGLMGAFLPLLYFAKKQKIRNPFKMHYGIKEMIGVSSGAIALGTTAGVVSDSKKNARPKIKEGIFQFLNATIPLLTIPPISEFMQNSPKLNNIPCRIMGTAAGLFGGMVVAADIANRIVDPKDVEPDRKLNYKDALANIDDALGALVLTKFPFINKLPVEPVLPFIYAWCGYRAGQNN